MQKARLQEYQITRTAAIAEQNLKEQEQQRKMAAIEAKRRAGYAYEQQKAITNHQHQKRKAQEMLLMEPLSPTNMREELEFSKKRESAAND